MSRNQCLLKYGRFWRDFYSRWSMLFLCISTQFQLIVAQRWALYRKFLVSLGSPDRHSRFAAVIPASHWSALIGAECTKIPKGWGQAIMQANGLGLFLSTAHRKSSLGAVGKCRENEMVSHHAWTTGDVFYEEAHIRRFLANYASKNDGTLHLLVCCLGEATGPDHLRCSPRHWDVHISVGIGFWKYVE
jgi:hypothetical protein